MKGVILAGGTGSRMSDAVGELPPHARNKHFLEVNGVSLVNRAVQQMRDVGLTEIAVVTNGEMVTEMIKHVGKDVTVLPQRSPLGIAHALMCAKTWCGTADSVAVLLADNLFLKMPRDEVTGFRLNPNGAACFYALHRNAQNFAIALFVQGGGNAVSHIVEKPDVPAGAQYPVVTGFYLYDDTVWERIRTLKFSARNELEITELNNTYAHEVSLVAHELKTPWMDACVSPGSLHQASLMLR